MDVIVIWFALSIMAGVVAGNKGRSGVGFFMLSVFLSPLIGLLGAWIARPAVEIEKEKAQTGNSAEYKRCPMCAETIKRAALKCRYCGADLAQSDVPTPPDEDVQAATVCSQLPAKKPAIAREDMTLEEILASESKDPR